MEETYKKPENLELFTYGTSLNNLPDWSYWEALREFESNAQDAAGKNIAVYKSGNDLVIQDQGDGMNISNLIIGETQKRGTESIGQFGEGLKQAMLVMTREGKTVEIWSGNLYITNTTTILKGFTTPIFAVKYGYNDVSYSGSTVIIRDWGEHETYQDRFLSDDMILESTQYGEILDVCQLFNKKVYIRDLSDYGFGYNISTSKVNRDRNVISQDEIDEFVGKIWCTCTNKDAWDAFFVLSKKGAKESSIYMSSYYMTKESKEAMQSAFYQVFGKDAALKTSEENAREAEHRGADIVDSRMFGTWVLDVLKTLVKTDVSFIKEKMGVKAFSVNEKDLTPEQKKNLKNLRKIGDKMGYTYQIIVKKLPDALGKADHANGIVEMDVQCLKSMGNCLSTYIHELAHLIYHTSDNTSSHVNACTDVASAIMIKCVSFLKEE